MILDLLQDLKSRGIRLWLEEDRLRFHAPKGAMTPEVKATLQTYKPEILGFLHEAAESMDQSADAIPKADRSQSLPLSFSQQRLWFLNKIEGPNPIYNMSCALRLRGQLMTEVLEQSFEELMDRHEVLRTQFAEENGTPFQIINEKSHFSLRYWDRPTEDVRALASRLAAEPFDLAKDALLRGHLIDLGPEDYVLLLSMHHIISDGWSLGILVTELSALYRAFAHQHPSPLLPLDLQFADYAAWQQQLSSKHFEPQRRYWRQRLAGVPGPLELPIDHARPAVQTYRGGSCDFQIPSQLLTQLNQLSQKQGVTLFMTLRAALAVLLSRLSGRTDICIGSPVAGRTLTQLEPLIGFFVNTLVFRTQWQSGASFTDLLAMVKKQDPKDLSHGDLPFDQVLDACQISRDQSHTPLFQVMFVLQNETLPNLSLPGLEMTQLHLKSTTSKFDLVLAISNSGTGQLTYNADLFEEATAQSILAMYGFLLGQIHRPLPMEYLPIMSKDMMETLGDRWNQTKTDYPRNEDLGALFEEQVRCHASIPAYEWQSSEGHIHHVTFAQLNALANGMAHMLMEKGVRAGSVVGLYTHPQVELMVTIVAIIKLGAIYLPLDPAYPSERLQLMLGDSEASMLLMGSDLELTTQVPQYPLPDLDQITPSAQSPEIRSFAGLPAYIVYTSGSTGTPKGIVIPQRAVTRLVLNTNYIQIEPASRLSRVSNISFDAATFEIWGALLQGATMVEAPPNTLIAPERFAQWLKTQAIDHMFLTVAVFNQTVQSHPDAFSGIQTLMVGGEALDPASINRCLQSQPPTRLLNIYGPTENTTFSISGDICQVPPGTTGIPLGKPISNSTALIVDRHLELSPFGVSGELLVGGDGLALGYLNRPGLTATKFIPDPFSGQAGARLYKTGDLAWRYRNGQIGFSGRIDHQIKLRGFRIELGEIEALLNAQPHLSQTLVLVNGKGPDKRLVAFAQCDENDRAAVLSNALENLKAKLPEYMIPTPLVLLPEMPLTPNGKVDRKALLSYPMEAAESYTAAYVAPRTALEAEVASCFTEILGVSKVGVHDDFFSLGGHSLLATRFISALQQRLSVQLPIRTLFTKPSVAKLAHEIQHLRREQGKVVAPPLVIAARDQPLQLSFGQQRLWMLDRLEPGSASYNISAVVRIRGDLQTQALQASLDRLINRHEALRTRFSQTASGQPVQEILASIDSRIQLHTVPPENHLEAAANQEALRPFDLEKGPLIRVSLLYQHGEDPLLVFNLHHIICDGWSISILLDELAELYRATLAETRPKLANLDYQYPDFSAWHRRWLSSGELERQISYWQQQLTHAPQRLELPLDRQRPTTQTHRGSRIQVALDTPTTQSLEALALAQNTTSFAVLQAIFACLLGRYARCDDVVIGSPVANRQHPELEQMIGLFVNTIALRFDLSGDPDLLTLIERVTQVVLDGLAHQDAPFEKVIEAVQPERDLSYSPIFQVMFAFQTMPKPQKISENLRLEPLPLQNVSTKFDFTLFLSPGEDQICGQLEFNRDLFDEATMIRFWDHFCHLARQASANPTKALSRMALPLPWETQILDRLNDTATDRLLELCFHQAFEAQARLTPKALAVISSRGNLTYQSLNSEANRLAHYLCNEGVTPDMPIGVFMHRSSDLVVSLLAILKAGGAYVPLDPSYPSARKATILENVSLILSERALVDQLPAIHSKVLLVESWSKLLTSQPETTPRRLIGPNHLAYIIYTSGSTGKPKGVAITHRNLMHYLTWAGDTYTATQGMGSPVHGSISFDATVTSLWLPLLKGHPLHIVDEGSEIETLANMLSSDHNFSFLKMTPAHLDALANLESGRPGQVPTLIVGGDALIANHLAIWRETSPETLVINEYGPTEATVGCCIHTARLKELEHGAVPIGHPIADTSLHVLEIGGMPAPLGVPGELFIEGAGLARGYWQRPGLTAERFLPNPFSQTPGSRFYRTGDLVRRLASGSLIFLGRTDHQIKLRGYRIEIGEIEVALASLEGIAQAAVFLNDQDLIAFYQLQDSSQAPGNKWLLSQLSQQLPSYMIPNIFTQLDRLPLTSHGKVDRQALAVQANLDSTSKLSFQAPRNAIESSLAQLYSELLETSPVSIHDHFFTMGGHSLLATMLVSRIRQELEVEVPLKAIFANPILRDLAQVIAAQGLASVATEAIPARDSQLPVPLSFSQERLWFLDRLEPGQTAYNMPVLLDISGPLDKGRLRQVAMDLCQRHEILRTTFAETDEGAIQIIHDDLKPAWRAFDPGELHEDEISAAIASEMGPFNLEKGPLLRLLVISHQAEQHTLFLNMHHIITDGWSTSQLVRELTSAYATPNCAIPPPSLSYADYASWQRGWLDGDELANQRQFWKTYLQGIPAQLELPFDRPRHHRQSFPGALEPIRLDPSHLEALQHIAFKHEATLFMGLHALFAILLSRYARQDDLCIGTPVANRQRPELEPLIGLFVNSVVLRSDLSGNPSFSEFLIRQRDADLEAFQHSVLPFEQVVELVSPERSLSHSPLFQVMFSMQTEPEVSLDMDDLQITPKPPETITAKFDFTLGLNGSGQSGAVEYNTDLFDRETIREFIARFKYLLSQVITQPDLAISQYPLCKPEDLQALLKVSKGPRLPTTNIGLIHQLLESQAVVNPHLPALHIPLALEAPMHEFATSISSTDYKVTYHQINRAANRIAHRLIGKGVGPETMVGICLKPGFALYASIFAVLKIGGTYVPLEPHLPKERLGLFAEDCGMDLILTRPEMPENIPRDIPHLDVAAAMISQGDDHNPNCFQHPATAANLIYTSGSTGKPKGVLVSHQSIMAHTQAVTQAFALESQDRILQFSAFSFDVFSEEVFPTLGCGATLVIPDPRTRESLYDFHNFLIQQRITIVNLPAAFWHEWVDELSQFEPLDDALRLVITGSDKVHTEKVATWQRLTQIPLLGAYGTTETTITNTLFSTSASSAAQAQSVLAIGHPIAGNFTIVVDDYLTPRPHGIPGELLIGGTSPARGYFGHPALTAQRFVPNPFSGEAGARIFRTGDLARQLAHGEIHCMGRIDSQVKIRGFRIELGEIEALLRDQETIAEAVVLLRQDHHQQPRLIGYVQPAKAQAEPSSHLWHQRLAEQLPAYMIPSLFVAVHDWPLTPSGKVDRKSLAAIEIAPPESETHFQVPRNPLESKLANLYAELLRVPQVSIHDHFFQLGGHSLLATKLISRLRQTLKLEVPLKFIFTHPTVKDLAQAIAFKDLTPTDSLVIPRRDPSQPIPLSFSQKRLWFLDQFEPGQTTYSMPATLAVSGQLDIPSFQKAVLSLCQRHEILRTTFAETDTGPIQIIHDEPNPEWRVIHCADLDKEAVSQLLGQERAKPFDLEKGPLLRFLLMVFAENEYTLFVNMHHIISDGWSFDVLVRELTTLYASFIDEKMLPLAPLPIQFADYAVWQSKKENLSFDRARNHWRQRLNAAPTLLELPLDRPRRPLQSLEGARLNFQIPSECLSQLEQFGNQHQATLFMTLRTALAVMLSRLCGTTDICIGSPIAGRSHLQLEGLIGFFVNTVVFRTQWEDGATFADLLAMVRRDDPLDIQMGSLPLDQVLETCGIASNQLHSPLFQVVFTLQNQAEPSWSLPDLEISPVALENPTAKFDLVWAIRPSGEGQLEYNTHIFDVGTAQSLIDYYLVLLTQIQSEQPVHQLALMPPTLFKQERDSWNQTRTNYPREQTLGQLFESQVALQPHAIAYEWTDSVGEVHQLNYLELNLCANGLAEKLSCHGVSPGSVVGLHTHPCAEMIIAIVGIVKLGAAYLPLDPGYPSDRLHLMVADSGADLLLIGDDLSLTQSSATHQLSLTQITRKSVRNPSISITSGFPAYLVYTSGSTGNPKGTIIPQRAVVRLVRDTHYVQLDAASRMARVSNISFDAATFEIWGALLNGGCMVEPPAGTLLEPRLLQHWLLSRRVEFMFLTVAVFNQTIEMCPDAFAEMNTLFVGGEALDQVAIRRCLQAKPPAVLGNGYGPTENTTFSVCGTIEQVPPDASSVPIGAPISNSTAYIADSHLELCPPGSMGELMVGGDGLALGYLNNPALTAAKFIPHPFSNHSGDRLYRTGDIARRTRDGILWCFGRMDHQIKLRGHRIELGEIESILNQQPHLSQAVALVRGQGNERRLVAFARCSETQDYAEIAAQALENLRQILPGYMVPTPLTLMNALPLTPNGKLDRKALESQQIAMARDVQDQAPSSPLEKCLGKAFCELLELSEVSIHDDFFQLGGHSLMATRLASRLRQELQTDVPLKMIFTHPVLSDLAKALASQQLTSAKFETIPKRNPEIAVPLSFSQERLWFLDKLEPGQTAYSIPALLELSGDLDLEHLHGAAKHLCQQHESLRTTFVETRSGPVQVIHEELEPEWRVLRADTLSQQAFDALPTQEIARPFDLENGPLLRFLLIVEDTTKIHILVNMHHIITDGWSMSIFIEALAKAYTQLDNPDPTQELTYADYASWQRQWLQGPELERHQQFWQNYLRGAPTQLELPFDRPRPPLQSFSGALEPIRMDENDLKALEQLTSDHGATLFMGLHTIFAMVLSRYARQDDLCIGTPIANRDRPELETLIGLFVNSVVMRSDLSGNPSFRELLQRQRDADLEAFQHGALPFEQVVELVRPERSMSHSPLFQVMFTMQTEPVTELDLDEFQITSRKLGMTTAKFDLTLGLNGRGQFGSVEYNTDLFDQNTIREFIDHFKYLLRQIIANPDLAIAEYTLGEPQQMQAVFEQSLGPKLPPAPFGLLHQILEHHASHSPQKTALCLPKVLSADGFGFEVNDSGAYLVTYERLNQLANRLAHQLIAEGVGQEIKIGICLGPSAALYIAVFAVLKTGATYVALDPQLPLERQRLYLQDSGISLVLTQEDLGVPIPEAIRRVDVDETVATPGPDHNPEHQLDPLNAAYMIYTSGSTGRPKGVLVSHHSLMAHAQAASAAFELQSKDRVLQFAAFSFDVFAEEVFPTLLSGATLVVPDPEINTSLAHFQAFLKLHRLSIVNLPAAFWHHWVDELALNGSMENHSLRLVITGSDKVYGEKVTLWQSLCSVPVISAYGTTETTITNTLHRPNASAPNTGVLGIGRPIGGHRAMVVDDLLRPLPPGIPGELVLGGTCPARGYHRRPALTAERFIPDPFATERGARLYRTGDLVRLGNGEIQYLGRLDAQVKLRGFRIEPAEIEAALMQHEGIREAVVVAHGDARKVLIAYLLPQSGISAKLDSAQLRPFLSNLLPDFMVPTFYLLVDQWPLTPSGKLNRRGLPKPDLALLTASDQDQAPQTSKQKLVAAVWREVLDLDQIGIHQNFFDLGGHSLLATQVVARLSERNGLALSLRQLFEAPTIAQLAIILEQAVPPQAQAKPIVVQPRGKPFPLSFTQQRLWFLDRLDGSQAAYSLSMALKVTGPFDPVAMERALTDLVARHETLRTTFTDGDGTGAQIIHPPQPFLLPLVKLEDESALTRLATEASNRPFDLEKGPLFRSHLYQIAPNQHALFMSVHHIVSDGWSLNLLARDIVALYTAHRSGTAVDLPALPIQFADYAVWQRRWLEGEQTASQLAFWQTYLTGAPPLLELPTDRPRPSVQTFNGALKSYRLSASTSKAFKDWVTQRDATLFMGLSSLFALLLGRYADQNDVVFGTPIAGRSRGELEQVHGFFVNTLALRIQLDTADSLQSLLDQTRANTLEIFAHQDIPFEQVVDHLQPQRNLAFSPIYQVMLVLQNMPSHAVETGDLTFTPIATEVKTAMCDLLFEFTEAEEGLKASLHYNTDLFNPETLEHMWQAFEVLVEGAINQPQAHPLSLVLMTPNERHRLLHEWNQTHVNWPSEETIMSAIETMAERTPDKTALIFENQILSYAAYNQAANRLAHYLQDLGVGPEVPVGVYMTRSLDMCISLLAILKAGGYYVPLDPSYPRDRLAMAIEDSGMPLVLCQAQWRVPIQGLADQVIAVDNDPQLLDQPNHNPSQPLHANHLAYTIYTSGSTGRPKGVMNTHQSIVNRLLWIQQSFAIHPSDRLVQKTPFTFDVSVWEFFWASMNGACLVIARPEGHKDPSYLVDLMERQQITITHFVPSMLQAFLEHPEIEKLPSLRQVMCSGEALNTAQVKAFFSRHASAKLLNLYGPTEAAVEVSFHECLRQPAIADTIPIGRPVANTALYILDKAGEPCPIGIPGELHIGGVQLARGYLKRPGLTADRFIPNPFAKDDESSRLYRTGDLTRFLPDGSIAFMGRIDHQVKIRGVRIELGEIETLLESHEKVLQSAVVVHEDAVAGKQLVGFASLKGHQLGQETDAVALAKQLKRFLAESLPETYVPAQIVITPEMPLLSNGKINRKALVPPEATKSTSHVFVPPRNRTERQIAAVWCEVLQLEKASIEDSFFELGGHSLLMVKAHLQLKGVFGDDLALLELFKYPTIRQLATHLRGKLGLSRTKPSHRQGRAATRTNQQTTTTRHTMAGRRRQARTRPKK